MITRGRERLDGEVGIRRKGVAGIGGGDDNQLERGRSVMGRDFGELK